MTNKPDLLIVDIKTLLPMSKGEGPLRQGALSSQPEIQDACIALHKGRVFDLGIQTELEKKYQGIPRESFSGAFVTPGLVDCHTHTLFAGNRASEFELRIQGASYQEILAAGGGILSSVQKLRSASDQELGIQLRKHLRWLKHHGIVALESKSGYGLSLQDELRSLRIINEAQGFEGLHIEATCLAAHVIPPEYKEQRDSYVELICNDLLPEVAAQGLASACDVFVEEGAFQAEEALRILKSAQEHNLRGHVHADQLGPGQGSRVALKANARSADHLEYIDSETIQAMAKQDIVAVLLPGSTFFLKQQKWAPARELIDKGVAVALATDFNPGTSPIANPAFIMSLACLQLEMKAMEALAAFTRNAAYSLGIEADYGSIAPGKRAAFALWDIDHVNEIPYYVGNSLVRDVRIYS